MKWLIMAVMYTTTGASEDPRIIINNEWKFVNRQACLSHLYESSAQFKDDILKLHPEVQTLHLTCAHIDTIIKLRKKYKKNEI